MKLTVLKSHPYGGKWRKIGDSYDAPRHHAKILVASGRCCTYGAVEEPAEAPVPDPPADTRQAQPYLDRASVAEEITVEPASDEIRQGHQRRDMQAEETE